MGVGPGRILGIIGGILAFVGALLPWATIESSLIVPPSQTFMGMSTGLGGLLVLIFGLLGMIMVAIGKKATAIVGLVFGLIAFIFALLAYIGLAAWAEIFGGVGATLTVGFGIYISLVGSILLIIGCGVAIPEAGKAAMAEVPPPPPMMEEMPPEPPMEEPPVE